MNSAAVSAFTQREPELLGQTVVVIGASAGIGLETARPSRAEGANVILTSRNRERLKCAALELGGSGLWLLTPMIRRRYSTSSRILQSRSTT